MIFDVLPLRERGWTLPRFRSCMLRPVRAQLSVVDEMDPHLNRATRVARLSDPATGEPLASLGELRDAVLVCVRSDYLTISGVERVLDAPGGRVIEYAQTWMLTSASLPSSG